MIYEQVFEDVNLQWKPSAPDSPPTYFRHRAAPITSIHFVSKFCHTEALRAMHKCGNSIIPYSRAIHQDHFLNIILPKIGQRLQFISIHNVFFDYGPSMEYLWPQLAQLKKVVVYGGPQDGFLYEFESSDQGFSIAEENEYYRLGPQAIQELKKKYAYLYGGAPGHPQEMNKEFAALLKEWIRREKSFEVWVNSAVFLSTDESIDSDDFPLWVCYFVLLVTSKQFARGGIQQNTLTNIDF